MRRFRPVVFGVASIIGFAACADHAITPPAPEDASFSDATASSLETTGQHLVMFNAQRVPANFATTVARSGGSVVAAYDRIGVAVVSGLDDAGAAALGRTRDVSLVTPDYLLPLELPAEVATDQVETAGVASPEDPAAAFFFPRQWNMHAIHAPQAWAAGFLGAPGVTVAILDTGIDYNHADLAGLVDLGRSASFVPSDDALVEAFFPGAHPVADLHWHGTHVGATVSSNAFAAAGVTSMTTLIGVKVCNVNGSCPTSGVLAGVMYAADQGADVINMSLGGLFLRSANPGFVSIINRAFTYANRAGTVVVVAAGNANTDLDRNVHPTAGHLPSLYAPYCDTSTTVCVSATGPEAAESLTGPWINLDTRAEYSNFGRSAIDVAAPGGRFPVGITDIGGVVWAACSGFSLVIPVCQTGTFVVGATGTSMASPHAAGVAALLVNRHGNNVGRVRTAIHRTADDVGQRGTDPFFGKGRVNAFRAATGG